MIPTSDLFDQSTITTLLSVDPLVQEYCAFFSLFDWSVVGQWQTQRSRRGRPGHPESAYLKAFLIRIHQKFIYASELRHFLLTHPLLILELGFRLVLDPSTPYGFDCEQTLPSRLWLSQKLRDLDQDLLQSLLHATVAALQAEIPGLGETVAFDGRISMPGSKKITSGSTFLSVMTKKNGWLAIPIVGWASKNARINKRRKLPLQVMPILPLLHQPSRRKPVHLHL